MYTYTLTLPSLAAPTPQPPHKHSRFLLRTPVPHQTLSEGPLHNTGPAQPSTICPSPGQNQPLPSHLKLCPSLTRVPISLFQPVSGHLPTFRVTPICIRSFPKLLVTSMVGTQVCAQAAVLWGRGGNTAWGRGGPPCQGNESGGQPSGPGRRVLLPGPDNTSCQGQDERGVGCGGRAGGSGGTEASARPGRLRLMFRMKLAQPSDLKPGDGYPTSILGYGWVSQAEGAGT